MALFISQNVFAQTCASVSTTTQEMTWTGTASTDWNDACNWSPNGVPTATNPLRIQDVANDPVIMSGTTAFAFRMDILDDASLTINSGGELNVLPTNTSLGFIGIEVSSNGTFTNNGTLNATTTASIRMIRLYGNTTFNNNGTANFKSGFNSIQLNGPNATVNNSASGIINFQGFRGFNSIGGSTGNVITNQGTMNYTGYDYFIALRLGFTLNNSGTIDVRSGGGIYVEGGTVNNSACAKILMPTRVYDNRFSGITANAGLMVTGNIDNNNGSFTNTGVLKYSSVSGNAIINNENSSVIVNDTQPIFTYGGTYDGTINGIFADDVATISAGTFTAPNTFSPSVSGSNRFAKITPSGGTCSYVVPFTYRTLPVVTTNAVLGQTPSSATLNGTINPMFTPLSFARFEVSTSPTFSPMTVIVVPTTAIETGNSPVAVSGLLTGIIPNRTYYYRLRAVNANGGALGEVRSTSVVLPVVTTSIASGQTPNGATLNGTINPMGGPITSAQFEVSTDAGFSTMNTVAVSVETLGSGSSPVAVSGLLTNMTINQVYYYRLRAANAIGSVLGEVRTVTRTSVPPVFLSKDVAIGADCTPFKHEIIATDTDPEESPAVSLISAPSWITLSQTGTSTSLTANPTQQQTGSFPIVVQVKSGEHTVTQTITITIQDLNHAPVFTSQAPNLGAIVRKGQSHSFTFIANDCDGDAITMKSDSFPTWFKIDASKTTSSSGSASVTYMGIAPEVAVHTLKMMASDGKLDASQVYNLHVTLQYVPIIVSTPSAAVEAGKAFTYDLKAASEDGDPMLYTLAEAPEWLKLVCDGVEKWQCKDSSTAQLIGTPTMQDLQQDALVKIMVLDDVIYNSLRSCQEFTIGTENGKIALKNLKLTNCNTQTLKLNEGLATSPLPLTETDSKGFRLDNYPNPFNPTTNFMLSIPTEQNVEVSVYDLTGRKVAVLHQGILSGQTTHTFRFDAQYLASGKYLVQVRGEHFAAHKMITLLK